MPTHGTFDVEISLAKGIIVTNFGLANGAILKLWAAHPYPKFSGEHPYPCDLYKEEDFSFLKEDIPWLWYSGVTD